MSSRWAAVHSVAATMSRVWINKGNIVSNRTLTVTLTLGLNFETECTAAHLDDISKAAQTGSKLHHQLIQPPLPWIT